MTLKLSLAFTRNLRVEALLDGRTEVKGVELTCHELTSSEIGRRQFGSAEFDISEMSLSFYIQAVAAGVDTWIGLPVFPSRDVYHPRLHVRADSPLRRPEDLAGARLGIHEYNGTLDVWVRGALLHEWGVAPESISWHVEHATRETVREMLQLREPDGVEIVRVPAHSLRARLAAGELDAALLAEPGTRAQSGDGIRPLFDNVRAEKTRYITTTQLFPVNHLVVIRRELAERHPWLAHEVMSAFTDAKRESYRRLALAAEPYLLGGYGELDLERDPLPYGVHANGLLIETFLAYLHEQHLTAARLRAEDVFEQSTLVT